MIAVIRISGMVDRNKDIENTLERLRLKRKYSCVILDDNLINKGMIKKVRNNVAYGEIDEETLIELIEKRGKLVNKNGKINAKQFAKEILEKKTMKGIELKPFFRLHPPRGGINSKQHFPKGVLGNNKEKINHLIKRML